ncbi:MAG TPA: amidase, partial [Bacillota bacterium]
MPEPRQEALRAVAAQLLPELTFDADDLRAAAGRLHDLMERLHALTLDGITDDPPPAFAYDPGRRAYARPPAQDAARTQAAEAGTPPPDAAPARGRPPALAAPPAAAPGADGGPARSVPGAGGSDPADLSLTDQADAVRTRQVSAEELVRAVLERAERLNPKLNAFITLLPEAALAAAREADRILAAEGPRGPLHGVPVAHKDIIFTRDVATTAGSSILAGYKPERDAGVVRRLKAAGALLIGKTNTHQFAFGATTESSHAGPARNPHDEQRSPGGSSGGSAAAVAARIVALATGTDTGGSIRIPAAACGIFGIKPTYGRVSKAGVFPLSWSQDHVGPLARTAADAALALRVMAGPDPEDPTTVGMPVQDYPTIVRRMLDAGLRGLRVGLLEDWAAERVDEGVRAALHRAVDLLVSAGAEVDAVSFVPPGTLIVVNRVIALAEAGAYHAPLLARRREGYLPDVRARMELGQFILARDYLLAQRLRTELTRRLNALFESCDL